MKVFLSWSGDLSQKVAVALRDWLPMVIQALEPYVSSEDIDKGARWSTDIAKELNASSFGVLCVTRDNVNAPWLNFEAGALSKTIDKSRVSPFLFGIKRAELPSGPLLQFQSTLYEKGDVKKLIFSLNTACEVGALEEAKLENIFDVWWPKLEEKMGKLEHEMESEPKDTSSAVGERTREAILEEILDLVREQQKLLRSPSELLPPRYIRDILIGMGTHSLDPAEHVRILDLLDRGRDLYILNEGHSNVPPDELSSFLRDILLVVRELLERPAPRMTRGWFGRNIGRTGEQSQ